MLKDGAHLFECDPRKPVDELCNLSATFEILKQRGDGDPRTTEHPRAADALGITLHSRAR
jgi:hypothetical protein